MCDSSFGTPESARYAGKTDYRGRLLVCTLDEIIGAKVRRGRLLVCTLDEIIGGKGEERKTTGGHAL